VPTFIKAYIKRNFKMRPEKALAGPERVQRDLSCEFAYEYTKISEGRPDNEKELQDSFTRPC